MPQIGSERGSIGGFFGGRMYIIYTLISLVRYLACAHFSESQKTHEPRTRCITSLDLGFHPNDALVEEFALVGFW